MKSFPHIRRALAGKLWYVHEQKMQEMLAFLEFKLAGGATAPEVLESIRATNQAAAARAQQSAGSGGAIAVVPIYGMIMHRQMEDISGGSSGTSTMRLSMALQQVVADPNVSSIVLDIDSPGGDVDGVDELATEIYQARKQKKITAVSNCLCASAAYYLASQASEIVVSPSSLTGSIGVYTMHEDDSAMLEAAGIKLELIKFGENKAEGNSLGPLSDSARAHMQELVDTYGNTFEKAVARGRGIKQDVVHGKFGQGRVFDAKTAVKIGMADRVGTLADVLGQSVSGKSSAAARAQDEIIPPYAGPWAGEPGGVCTGKLECKCGRHVQVDEASVTSAETVHPISEDAGGARYSVAAQMAVVDAAVKALQPKAARSPKKPRADDNGCTCDCDPCDDGDCPGCDHDDCGCEGCACDMATGKAKAVADAAAVRARDFTRMRHELSQAASC